MDYFELYIPSSSDLQSEIYMAQLSDFPFESFQQEETSLKAYIREDDLLECRSELERFLHTTGVKWRLTEMEAQNWNSLWESNYDPVEIDTICRIRAPFHEPSDEFDMEIIIMPKMSFGTGHHATTHLMITEIMCRTFLGQKGLDMGSGTGVLSIIAAKLGATHIDAIDIDEWAYENCIENIAENRVADRITPYLGDASKIQDDEYDFVFANITSNVLLADMPKYVEVLKQGAPLIMSGILESDIPAIKAKAESLGMKFESSALRDNWAVVSFTKI